MQKLDYQNNLIMVFNSYKKILHKQLEKFRLILLSI